MTYLLDTNTCIKYLNGTSENIKRKLESNQPQDIVVILVTHNTREFNRVKELKTEDWEK